jgi:hypothetical protein
MLILFDLEKTKRLKKFQNDSTISNDQYCSRNKERNIGYSPRYCKDIDLTRLDLKATIRFLGHTAQLVDIYASFARQAAQAMSIPVSKTLFPIKNTPNQLFQPAEYDPDFPGVEYMKEEELLKKRQENVDTSGISFDYYRWTVNRSPFVHGRHQDQFEVRTYERDIELMDADTETIKRWLHYVTQNLPFGVGIEYKLYEYEKLQPKKLPASGESPENQN